MYPPVDRKWKRRLRRSLAIAFVFFCNTNFVKADTVPSQAIITVVSNAQVSFNADFGCGWDGTPGRFATIDSACMCGVDGRNASGNPQPPFVYTGYQGGNCYASQGGSARATAQYQQKNVCPQGSNWNGSQCTITEYTCPTTGTWILSADKQACIGCSDPSKVLNQEGVCVSPDEKSAGAGCESPRSSSFGVNNL